MGRWSKQSSSDTATAGRWNNPENKAYEQFADMMIDQIKAIKEDWHKPWLTNGLPWPRSMYGKKYNGMNAFMLILHSQKNGYNIPVFGTFNRFVSLNYTQDANGEKMHLKDDNGEDLPQVMINKGEKSFPVVLSMPYAINKETKEKLDFDVYDNLPEGEKDDYKVYFSNRVYQVFNIDQTNLAQARPELYNKIKDETLPQVQPREEGRMFKFEPLDAMIENNLYICPIKPTEGDKAYYSPSRNEIVVPLKSQFEDGESFYSTLLHEMTHATGKEDVFNRLKPDDYFGSKGYGREELVAEMTAALVCSQHGFEKHIKEDSASYLSNWLQSLKEDPSYIKTVLGDVKKASCFINKHIEEVQLKIDNGEDLSQKPAESEDKAVSINIENDGQVEAAKDIQRPALRLR